MGIHIPLWFSVADLATAPDDVQRVGTLALVLAERHAAWRGCSERGVWLPLRLACAVTGLLRCQVTRAAWRLQAMAPGPETADELAMAA